MPRGPRPRGAVEPPYNVRLCMCLLGVYSYCPRIGSAAAYMQQKGEEPRHVPG